MIDNFSLALSHGLLFLAAVRLLFRADLDRETPILARPDLTPGPDTPPGA